jgi:hypothetical protein
VVVRVLRRIEPFMHMQSERSGQDDGAKRGHHEGFSSGMVRASGNGHSLECGELLDHTIAIWQPKTERKLTREDAREIMENMIGLFSILDEWDRADKAKGQL